MIIQLKSVENMHGLQCRISAKLIWNSKNATWNLKFRKIAFVDYKTIIVIGALEKVNPNLFIKAYIQASHIVIQIRYVIKWWFGSIDSLKM